MSAAAVARTAALRAARRPSTWGLAALGLVPAAIAAIAGAAGGVASSAEALAIMVIAPLFVVALVAATAGDGYAQRTVVYWFVRPMARTSPWCSETSRATQRSPPR
ncbi:MAG: hypothetical protein R3A52_23840 [Polyangiales bacterium]